MINPVLHITTIFEPVKSKATVHITNLPLVVDSLGRNIKSEAFCI